MEPAGIDVFAAAKDVGIETLIVHEKKALLISYFFTVGSLTADRASFVWPPGTRTSNSPYPLHP